MSLSVPLEPPSKEILHISTHYLVILVKYIFNSIFLTIFLTFTFPHIFLTFFLTFGMRGKRTFTTVLM